MHWSATDSCTAYAVIEDYLPRDEAQAIAEAFPRERTAFRRMASFRERKWTSNAFHALPEILRDAAMAIQAPDALALAEGLSGISRLRPDPSCYAGGVSIMEPGDFLNPHIDNSHDATRNLYRRLNLLYYLNPDWREGDGGELELWNRDIRRPVRIAPRFNRLVVMQTDRTSWHGVAPIRHGERRCISSYFFTEASPDGEHYFHVTEFSARPEQPARRAWAALDARARSIAGHLGFGRGKGHAGGPKRDMAPKS